jgi:glycerate kinase
VKIIVAMDKFKGSCTSEQAAQAVIAGIQTRLPQAQTKYFPMSDGGEGFAAAHQQYLKTKTIHLTSCDPLGRKIKATYEWQPQNKWAIIELATASGWALLNERERNPMRTSTLGTGLLIIHALKKGARKIILGLGGSATHDGGMGIAYALGFRCLDSDGNVLSPSGAALIYIRRILPPPTLPKIQWELCGDVNNPLFGKKGAAYTFAAQKGATPTEVELLDQGLRNLAVQIKKHTGIQLAGIKGMGAAGGAMCFLHAYMKSTLHQGADWMIRLSGIEKSIKKADLLITGEGAIDEQSIDGKLISRLIPLAKTHRVPIVLACGKVIMTNKLYQQWKNIPILELMQKAPSEKKAIQNPQPLLKKMIADFFS